MAEIKLRGLIDPPPGPGIVVPSAATYARLAREEMQPKLRGSSWVALFLGLCTVIPLVLVGSRGVVQVLLAAALALGGERVLAAWWTYKNRGYTERASFPRMFFGDRLFMLALGSSFALAIMLITLPPQHEPESGTSSAQISSAEMQEACKVQHRMDGPLDEAKITTRTDFNGEELYDGPQELMIYKACNYPPLQSSPSDVYTEVKVLSVDTDAHVTTGGAVADRIDASCSAVEAKYTFVHQGTEAVDPITVTPDDIMTITGERWKSPTNDKANELGFVPKRGEAIVLRSNHFRLDSVRCI